MRAGMDSEKSAALCIGRRNVNHPRASPLPRLFCLSLPPGPPGQLHVVHLRLLHRLGNDRLQVRSTFLLVPHLTHRGLHLPVDAAEEQRDQCKLCNVIMREPGWHRGMARRGLCMASRGQARHEVRARGLQGLCRCRHHSRSDVSLHVRHALGRVVRLSLGLCGAQRITRMRISTHMRRPSPPQHPPSAGPKSP